MTEENIKQFVKENGYDRYYKLITTSKAFENAFTKEWSEFDCRIGSEISTVENEVSGSGRIVGGLLAKSEYADILAYSGLKDLFIVEADNRLVAGVIIREFLHPICLDKVEETVNCEDEDWEDEE